MNRWSSIERWAPLAACLLTFLAFLGYAWRTDQRIARDEGIAIGLQQQINQRNQIEVALRSEVETWKAYVVTLKGEMAKAGIPTPPPPRPKE